MHLEEVGDQDHVGVFEGVPLPSGHGRTVAARPVRRVRVLDLPAEADSLEEAVDLADLSRANHDVVPSRAPDGGQASRLARKGEEPDHASVLDGLASLP